MVFWIANVGGLAIAYLVGSTPTAYLAGKVLIGVPEIGRRRSPCFKTRGSITKLLRAAGWTCPGGGGPNVCNVCNVCNA